VQKTAKSQDTEHKIQETGDRIQETFSLTIRSTLLRTSLRLSIDYFWPCESALIPCLSDCLRVLCAFSGKRTRENRIIRASGSGKSGSQGSRIENLESRILQHWRSTLFFPWNPCLNLIDYFSVSSVPSVAQKSKKSAKSVAELWFFNGQKAAEFVQYITNINRITEYRRQEGKVQR